VFIIYGIMQRAFTIGAAIFLSALLAAPPAIGVATSTGSFQVNHARVSGNSTVFDGAAVETAEATSRVRLNGGAWIELAPESKATIFAHRAKLEEGFGEWQAGSDFQVEARGLRVVTAGPKTMARMRLDGANIVLVDAVNGAVHVYNEAGLLVANVHPGAALSFQPQAAAATTFQMSGCLLMKDKRYILVDLTSNQTVEVQGESIGGEVGNRIQITGVAVAGAKPVAGASQVIEVRKFEQIGRGGCVAAATGSNASTKPDVAGGKSHKGAIIAGVLVAGAGGGVAAAVCCKGKKSSTSP
jgi:hypothetical protein